MSLKYRSALTSPDLLLSYTDFILSRESIGSTDATLEFYYFTVGKFLEWAEQAHSITKPDDCTGNLVREYLVLMRHNGRQDSTIWNCARALKTLFSYWHSIDIMQGVVKFDLPKVVKKKQPRLTPETLAQVLKVCNIRDRALVMFLADCGVRRSEVIALNWEDVDMQTGMVMVKRGKGGKARMTVIGAKTRRMLLSYMRSVPVDWRKGCLFKTDDGNRFSPDGFRCIFKRLEKKTGIRITAHAMRRTWTNLSLRAKMDALHIQGLGGWESLDMVVHYAQMDDLDLFHGYQGHSPIDNLDKMKDD
jgi:integrase/recombinase XerD